MILNMIRDTVNSLIPSTSRSKVSSFSLSEETYGRASRAITALLSYQGIQWRNAELAMRSIPFLAVWLEYQAVQHKGIILSRSGLILGACSLAAQIDNETSWQKGHLIEGSYLNPSAFSKWVKLYGYRGSGDIPKNTSSLTQSQLINLAGMKYIGRFLPHLTGQANYEAILPLAMKQIAPPQDPDLRAAYELAKQGRVTSLTAEQLNALANWGPANLAVLVAFLEANLGGRLRSTKYRSDISEPTMFSQPTKLWPFLSREDVGDPAKAMDACMFMAFSMRYPDKRKVWPKGGTTPSWADIGIKIYSIMAYFIKDVPSISHYDISKTSLGFVSSAPAERDTTSFSDAGSDFIDKSAALAPPETIVARREVPSRAEVDSVFNNALANLSKLAAGVSVPSRPEQESPRLSSGQAQPKQDGRSKQDTLLGNLPD